MDQKKPAAYSGHWLHGDLDQQIAAPLLLGIGLRVDIKGVIFGAGGLLEAANSGDGAHVVEQSFETVGRRAVA